VRELHAAGRYGEALELTQRIGAADLRAEWRFQLLNDGGDLPAALEAAEEGLCVAPTHRGLLQNATVCAVTLGIAERSAVLCERWRAAVEAEVTEPGERAAALEATERMRGEVARLKERDSALLRAGRRAYAIAGALLAAAIAALLWLGWRKDARD
jgi:hypothetical protein